MATGELMAIVLIACSVDVSYCKCVRGSMVPPDGGIQRGGVYERFGRTMQIEPEARRQPHYAAKTV